MLLPLVLQGEDKTGAWTGQCQLGSLRAELLEAPPTMDWAPFYLLPLVLSTGQSIPGLSGVPLPNTFLPSPVPRGICPVWAHSTSSLCFEFAGLCAEPVLTQRPSASASLGASAQLTRTLSSEYSTYTIRWYQQRPGNGPRYMMYIKSDGSHSKGGGIPERFSGSSSGAVRYLTISHVQSEDEAEYICGESHDTMAFLLTPQ